MRRLAALLAVASLALPASALAVRQNPDDGSVTITNASGTIVLAIRGGVIGRFDSGRIVVEDPISSDGAGPVFFNCDRQHTNGTKTSCTSTDVRFRALGGLYRIRIVGTGISLSAVGRGTVTLVGAGTLDDGTYAFDDNSPGPLPLTATRFPLGTPPAPAAGGTAP